MISKEECIQINKVYIISDFIGEESLFEWLSKSPSVWEIQTTFCTLLNVINHIHNKGVVHNNLHLNSIWIKPGEYINMYVFVFYVNSFEIN